MTFREMSLSLQLIAEERYGFTARERLRVARALEDRLAASLREAGEHGTRG